MSQHDFNIANQTFPSFRSDLNDALVAAATMSAGASAPTTPYAYQLWFDTTTNTWKVRNSGNTTWISTITTDLATGNVGIGGSPSALLHLEGSDGVPQLKFLRTGTTIGGIIRQTSSPYGLTYDAIDGNASVPTHVFRTSVDGSSFTERMRIDSSGNLHLGKASVDFNAVGITAQPAGVFAATRDGGTPVIVNRKTSDGELVQLQKDGTAVGSIGAFTSATSALFFGSLDTALLANSGNDSIHPWNASTNANRDNAIDLGNAANRFDDIYATNGTIQTSDQNEKQQIAALTDAEITAAKAISALFKTYKWNSAVTEKGDAARTHAGVIAQDVQAAMTAAGLDAGDYAFFISSTWWETQTEVPAVEAVEAVYEDVVIPAVLDEDGNEVEAERTEQRTVTEAVEAVAAYTRTDTYDTQAEAPEGATERNRKGIRYPELLAFVGAATEQRLANIETRLTALEA